MSLMLALLMLKFFIISIDMVNWFNKFKCILDIYLGIEANQKIILVRF